MLSILPHSRDSRPIKKCEMVRCAGCMDKCKSGWTKLYTYLSTYVSYRQCRATFPQRMRHGARHTAGGGRGAGQHHHSRKLRCSAHGPGYPSVFYGAFDISAIAVEQNYYSCARILLSCANCYMHRCWAAQSQRARRFPYRPTAAVILQILVLLQHRDAFLMKECRRRFDTAVAP